jgi:RNase P subunit RPR2
LNERRQEEMTTEKQAEWWMGLACKKCGAPLAVQRLDDPSKSAAAISAVGWRVSCTSCGETEYYPPGTQMLKIKASN